MTITRPVFVALALGASLVACKVHKTKRGFSIGTGCDKTDESCASASSGNLCRGGALVTVSCKGPTGCVDAPPADVACGKSLQANAAVHALASRARRDRDDGLLLAGGPAVIDLAADENER